MAILLGAIGLCSTGAALYAEVRDLDVGRSSITVNVYKSGLFAAFADNHVITAPIASGSLSDEPPLAILVTVKSGDLRVVDPDLAADRRAEVQARMVSAEVLDAARFPVISFASTAIVATGDRRWQVTGNLSIHGRTRSVTFPVVRIDDVYRGDALIKQRDFGIEPIRVAGGTVKVKDEIKVHFEIVTLQPPRLSGNIPRVGT